MQGWPAVRLDLLLTLLIAVMVVIGLPAVGVVLMAAMLILPGAMARFWTDRLGRLLGLSALAGAGRRHRHDGQRPLRAFRRPGR